MILSNSSMENIHHKNTTQNYVSTQIFICQVACVGIWSIWWREKRHLCKNLSGTGGFPYGSASKEATCNAGYTRRFRFHPWVGKIPWRRKWKPTPVFLPGESHGQRSLVGCSAKDHKQLDTTEQHTHPASVSSFCCCSFIADLILWMFTVSALYLKLSFLECLNYIHWLLSSSISSFPPRISSTWIQVSRPHESLSLLMAFGLIPLPKSINK